MQSSHSFLNFVIDFLENRLLCELCHASHLSFESVYTGWMEGGLGCTALNVSVVNQAFSKFCVLFLRQPVILPSFFCTQQTVVPVELSHNKQQ